MAVTLKEKAYVQLRELIMSGDIHTSGHLTEKYLVELLQMSRTPIRAALERLAAEGVVLYSPNKGLSLPEHSFRRVVDFFDFRIAIEGHIVYKLASRIWEESEIAWFRNNLAEQNEHKQNLNYAAFTKADTLFHSQLAILYDNQEIVQTMEQLQDKLFLVALGVLKKDNARIQRSYEDHCDIFEFILANKPEEARAKMIEHLEFGARILVF